MKKLYIIGGGMGDSELLTSQAKAALHLCEEVYAFDRLADLYGTLHSKVKKCTYSELLSLLEQTSSNTIGVIVSGDTGFFSVTKTLKEKFEDKASVITICGVNSLQYLCSKINLSYENIKVISLHGRNQEILGSLAYQRYTFVLTGSDHRATDILMKLTEMGLGHIKVTVGEYLSMEQERVITGTIQEVSKYLFDPLSVMLFENSNPVQKEQPIFDDDFIRDKTPMTKQEVRWVSVNYLELQPKEVVFDIGAGTGSVSIEMARKVYDGVVYSMERDADAYSLLNQNKQKFGAFNVITILGNAMDHIKTLPVPDKAFIGGSGKELEELLNYLFQVNPDIKIVINAIALETLSSGISLLEQHNCKVTVSCLNVARNKKLGDHNLMMANNPIYIIMGERASEEPQ